MAMENLALEKMTMEINSHAYLVMEELAMENFSMFHLVQLLVQ